MPSKPATICRCGAVKENGACPKCAGSQQLKQLKHKMHDTLYGRRWKERSRSFLLENPWCTHCLEEHGRFVKADVADHVQRHKYEEHSFWNGELQPLCKMHHDRKTATGG